MKNNSNLSARLLPTASALLLCLSVTGLQAEDRTVQSGYGGRVVSSSGDCVASIGGREDLCGQALQDADGDGVTDDKDKCPDTPKGAQVDADGCMPTLVLNNIQFANNSAKLTEEGHATLVPIAKQLRERPDITGLTVTGHTSSTGSDKLNQKLSEDRAKTVAKMLELGGVAVPIATRGMGKSAPVADNATEEGQAQNRRVEIEVTK